MRDIIYRGKDKHKKWHYGFYLKEKTIDGNVLSYIDRSDMLYNIDKVEVDPNTIQEYSGFTDKNKTRVFEGDILYKQGYWKYYVGFEDGAFRAIPLNLVQKYSWVHYNLKHYVGNDILDEDKFEIIGNIYDKEDEQMELNQCNDCKEIKKLKDELKRMNQTHHLKLLDEYWNAVKTGHKTFELRQNYRGYQDGDVVKFYRYAREPRGSLGYYDGKSDYQYLKGSKYVETMNEADTMSFIISYVLPLSALGINSDYVVFGIKRIEE